MPNQIGNVFTHTISQAALIIIFLGNSLHAQGSGTAARERQSPHEINSVKALIGLTGITPNSEGTLSFSSRDLRFTTEQGSAAIERKRIIAVSSGDERVETGGTTGKIARMVIPYGGGLALASVTHKKVGLLTVEFMDTSGQYHGAVFELATEEIPAALGQLDNLPPTVYAPSAEALGACPAQKVQVNTVRVETVNADLQSEFPAEDRVLLYERLVQQLKSEKTIKNVYRAGDRTSEGTCAEFTVAVRAVAFNKGDQAVRASLGPLGHFVGTTKLTFHLTVFTQNGTPIIDEDMKKSEGSDSDSLNVTKVISKAVIKNLKKSRSQLHKAQVA